MKVVSSESVGGSPPPPEATGAHRRLSALSIRLTYILGLGATTNTDTGGEHCSGNGRTEQICLFDCKRYWTGLKKTILFPIVTLSLKIIFSLFFSVFDVSLCILVNCGSLKLF